MTDGGAPLVRALRLDLEDPQARPRVLGIAIAELVAASAELVELRISGVRHRFAVRTAGPRVWVATSRVAPSRRMVSFADPLASAVLSFVIASATPS